MPYKFGEYVSTYVDPQSVAISETLRNRFTENFKANDQLTMAVEQMKAALPFENDMAKKKELETQINQKLETLSSRGDYENLGFAVHKATKEFSTAYAPIKENYDRYQSALKDLDEQYKKGDINAEDYNMATSYITKGYKGFEIDPTTGKVKEGTMYSAPTIYKDPKLMDKMKERLSILYEKKTGKKSSNAGLDANGVWKVTSGETLVEIPEEDVMDVYNSVIEEPDVRMYLDQRADMKLYAAEKSGNTGAYLDAKIKSNQSAIDQINEAIASGKYSAADKKILGNQITALAEENKKIEAAKADPNVANTYLKSQFRDEILDPVKAYAMKKAGVREYTSEYSYENNFAIQLDAIKRKNDEIAALGGTFYEQGIVTAADDISGNNFKAKKDYISGITNQISTLEREIAEGEKGGMSADMLAQKKSQLASNINERTRVEGQLRAVADKAISMSSLERQDPTLIGIFKEMMPGASSGQIYTQLQNTFDNKGDQDYIDFQTTFDKKYGAGAFDRHMKQYYSYKKGVSTMMQGEGKDAGARLAGATVPSGVTEFNSPADVFSATFGTSINKALPEIKISNLYNAGLLDIGDPQLAATVTKAKDNYFVGKMPFSDQTFIVNGERRTGAQLAAEGYVIKAANPNIMDNTYMIHMEKGGDKPGSITAQYDGRQVQSPALQEAMNNPEVRFGALIGQHNTRINGATSTIKTVKFNGRSVDVNVVSQGDSNPIITFTDPTTGKDLFTGGAPTKFTVNDTEIKNAINRGWLKF